MCWLKSIACNSDQSERGVRLTTGLPGTFNLNSQGEYGMKGNDKVIAVLNQLLADELTAISQYMVHSEMCDNWGYGKLHKAIEHQAMDEMHHAEWLIQRIIFFEGAPIVTKLNSMKIGKSVLEMVTTDQASELDAIHAYNAAIRLAQEADDQATADLLRKILLMEEGHVEWAEQQSDQIEQMGLANYLSNQAAS
jgi:bacterioferritin